MMKVSQQWWVVVLGVLTEHQVLLGLGFDPLHLQVNLSPCVSGMFQEQ